MSASQGCGEDAYIVGRGSINVCSFVYVATQDAECMQSELGIGIGARDPVAFGKEQERSCEKCCQEPNDRM